MSIKFAVFGIDQPERTLEAAGDQIARHQPADAALLATGADEGDRARREHAVEVTDGHDASGLGQARSARAHSLAHSRGSA